MYDIESMMEIKIQNGEQKVWYNNDHMTNNIMWWNYIMNSHDDKVKTRWWTNECKNKKIQIT